jgi:hypothetical protein
MVTVAPEPELTVAEGEKLAVAFAGRLLAERVIGPGNVVVPLGVTVMMKLPFPPGITVTVALGPVMLKSPTDSVSAALPGTKLLSPE